MGNQASGTTLSARAPAKINLFLHVLGRRADGLHALDSLVVFADIHDRLTLRPVSGPGGDATLEVSGPFAHALGGEGGHTGAEDGNLVLRAAAMLARIMPTLRLGHFHLTKVLPVAAGLGGGSADAAAALRLLAAANPALPGGLPNDVAAQLGADVPACLAAVPVWLEGTGEKVSPGPALPPIPCVLVNPDVPMATAPVFARLGLQPGQETQRQPLARPGALKDVDAVTAFLAGSGNDLEAPALAMASRIAIARDALAAQPGCRLARMSGSGATLFGLFLDTPTAAHAAQALQRAHPGWWVRAATLNAPAEDAPETLPQ